MKKAWPLFLLVCLLILLPSAVLAEGLEPTGMENEQTEDVRELQLSMKFQYMPSIDPIKGTNLITMKSKTDSTLGVFTSEGQEVIPYGLAAVTKLTHDFLSVTKDKNDLNSLAIYKVDGTQISDYSYGNIIVYDSRWVAGCVLEKASGSEKDVSLNKVDYLIIQFDLYYISEDGASMIASLDREHYKASKLHGDYISIQDREGLVTAYDRNFQPVDISLKDVNAAYYRVENYKIINNITNEEIADGYTAVQEAVMSNRMLLIASTTDMDGSTQQVIMDTDGKVLMPAEYKVVTAGDPYVVVANKDGLRGLYSLAEQRLIVPCEFSNIFASDISVDSYINNGYVSVEKDGKRGYVDVRTGEITCQPAYNSRIAKVYGCSTVFDGENGYVLIAADGIRTELYEYDEIPATNGDGYLLVAKKDGFYGVIDWHGNELLPFIHKNIITLTYDSKALIRTSTGLELDVITAR